MNSVELIIDTLEGVLDSSAWNLDTSNGNHDIIEPTLDIFGLIHLNRNLKPANLQL